jgi:hypothetical protein
MGMLRVADIEQLGVLGRVVRAGRRRGRTEAAVLDADDGRRDDEQDAHDQRSLETAFDGSRV